MTAHSNHQVPSISEVLTDRVEQHAFTDPGRIALIHDGQSTTYADLVDQVRAFAKALLALGVRKGDRVAMLSTPRPEFLISYLAAIRLGAIWTGLNPRYSARELAYSLSDASPSVIFSLTQSAGDHHGDTLERAMIQAELVDVDVFYFGQGVGSRAGLDDFLARGSTVADDALATARASFEPSDAALLVYTSGTTGQPKGALLRHSGITRLGFKQSAAWAVEQPRIMCNQPINHVGCVGDLCSVTLFAGGSLVFTEKFDASETLELLERYQVNGLFQVPTQLQRIADDPRFDETPLPHLRLVGWGGAPLPPTYIKKFRERGCSLRTTYGLTEVTSSVTYSRPGATDEELTHTVGLPDPELSVRLLREDGEWAEAGESGEVCVRHPTVMFGYLNRPEQTAEAFTLDGWLRTGDVGEFREDGNLQLVGRRSEMYKSGGYNIYPREIEKRGIHLDADGRGRSAG